MQLKCFMQISHFITENIKKCDQGLKFDKLIFTASSKIFLREIGISPHPDPRECMVVKNAMITSTVWCLFSPFHFR